MKVELCTDEIFIRGVLLDDWGASSVDGCDRESFDLPINAEWLSISSDGDHLGVWGIEAKSNICASVHLYVLKEYRAKYWDKCVTPMIEFIKENSAITKLIAEIPENRKNTLMCAIKTGFKREAILKDAIVESGELTDIVIMSRFI